MELIEFYYASQPTKRGYINEQQTNIDNDQQALGSSVLRYQ